jgi:hypothetical protein
MRRAAGLSKRILTWPLGVLILSAVLVSAATKPGTSYSQLAELTEAGQAIGAESGISVAMSGNVAVVGANNPGSQSGAAYVFVKPSTGWANMNPTATLTSSDGVDGDGFGQVVAIGRNTILVAAQNLSTVYVYVKPPDGWRDMTQTAKLTASVPTSRFGLALGISGDTVVIGAYGTDQAGTAYVYEKPSGGWVDMQQTAELLATEKGDFGLAVAVCDDTIVVGAPTALSQNGVVYVYTKPAGGWEDVRPVAALTSKVPFTGGNFGGSLSLSGNTVVAGAFLAGDLRSGEAYVFVKPRSGWANMTETAQLVAPNGANDFGLSVFIRGSNIAVGAPASGGVYVFVRPTDGWVTTSAFDAKLEASDGASQDYFGAAVSVAGSDVLVGAFQHNSLRGAAYIFGS